MGEVLYPVCIRIRSRCKLFSLATSASCALINSDIANMAGYLGISAIIILAVGIILTVVGAIFIAVNFRTFLVILALIIGIIALVVGIIMIIYASRAAKSSV